MNPDEIIKAANEDGVYLTLTPDGEAKAGGDQEGLAAWLPIFREHKPAIILELHRQRRSAKVLAMLGDKTYAVYVEDDRSDPVIATCAIRGLASFELAIPAHSYNAVILLELLEKHSTEPRAKAPQPSGNTNISTDTNGRSQAHPRRPS